jgi:hypothetical protein
MVKKQQQQQQQSSSSDLASLLEQRARLNELR